MPLKIGNLLTSQAIPRDNKLHLLGVAFVQRTKIDRHRVAVNVREWVAPFGDDLAERGKRLLRHKGGT
jgi:hypothetical protein